VSIRTSYYTSNSRGDMGEKLFLMPRPTTSPKAGRACGVETEDCYLYHLCVDCQSFLQAGSSCGLKMRTEGRPPKRTKRRFSKYLNRLVKQDQRGLKSRASPLLGFKSLESAAIKIAGIKLLLLYQQGRFRRGAAMAQMSESLITNAQIDQ